MIRDLKVENNGMTGSLQSHTQVTIAAGTPREIQSAVLGPGPLCRGGPTTLPLASISSDPNMGPPATGVTGGATTDAPASPRKQAGASASLGPAPPVTFELQKPATGMAVPRQGPATVTTGHAPRPLPTSTGHDSGVHRHDTARLAVPVIGETTPRQLLLAAFRVTTRSCTFSKKLVEKKYATLMSLHPRP